MHSLPVEPTRARPAALFLFGCALAGASALASTPAPDVAAERVIYRATFSNDSGQLQPLSAYAWTVQTAGGGIGEVGIQPRVSMRVPDEVAATTPFGVSQAEGYLAIGVPAVPRGLLVTTAEPALRVPFSALRSLSWDWTAANSTAHIARPAVRIAGQWYVAAIAPYTSRNSATLMTDAITATFRFPSPESEAWYSLPQLTTADIGATGAAPYALRGQIEQIGLWLRIGGSPGTISIDNIQVTAALP